MVLFSLANILMFENYQCEYPCDGHELFIVFESLKALFFENTHGFQLCHLHFKEFMLLMDSKNKSKPCFQISKVNSCTFVKALVENDSFELT